MGWDSERQKNPPVCVSPLFLHMQGFNKTGITSKSLKFSWTPHVTGPMLPYTQGNNSYLLITAVFHGGEVVLIHRGLLIPDIGSFSISTPPFNRMDNGRVLFHGRAPLAFLKKPGGL